MPRTKTTLSRLDWIEAGQRLLIDGGISKVKLATLTQQLRVTSGSFYHHFSGLRDYRHALADYYGGENVDRVIEELEPVQDPAERIRLFRLLAEQWDIARLDSAMRVWATSDEHARAAVARLDDRMLELLRTALSELGFSQEQARVRALLAFSAGVGQPFLFGRPASSDDVWKALDIVLAR